MNYSETLQWLYTQLPMYQRVGAAAMKKDLTNIRKLCAALGDPHRSVPVIHIAGTNGKGSTAHMLSAVLQAAGHQVGLYTSPHYRDFRERIKRNGELVPEEWVVTFVEKHRDVFTGIQPSFFEITVAMAFQYFAEADIDIAVIETGLGGRLDSTNIVTPELSIITNISYDHMQFLGDTLPQIAGEKAGIIKPGVPVVIGETHAESRPVFLAKAEQEAAPISFADRHVTATLQEADFRRSVFRVMRDEEVWFDRLVVDVYGEYQRLNLQTVLHSLQQLSGRWGITDSDIETGLGDLRRRTRFLGRWQHLGESPLILSDSAHNEAGLQQVVAQLRRIPHRRLHLVFGMVNDKDTGKVLSFLPAEATYYFARPDVPRGLDAGELQQRAAAAGRKGEVYPSVGAALAAAKAAAAADDLIFVGGSIFVVAEVV